MKTPLSALYTEDPLQRLVAATIDIEEGAVCIIALPFFEPDHMHSGIFTGSPGTDQPQIWAKTFDYDERSHSVAFAMVKISDDEPEVPTFLVGGGWQSEVQGPSSSILVSNDGINWATAFNTTRLSGFAFSAFVWNPDDLLWYAFFDGTDGPGDPGGMQIYTSPDGHSWSGGATFANGDDVAAVAAFRDLCNKPQNKGKIPDGWQGYDPDTKMFIKPADLIGWSARGGDYEDHGGGITVEVDDGPPPSDITMPPSPVVSVSFAGGVWNAIVETETDDHIVTVQVYVSTDAAQTWVRVFEHSGLLALSNGVAAGSASDIAAYISERSP